MSGFGKMNGQPGCKTAFAVRGSVPRYIALNRDRCESGFTVDFSGEEHPFAHTLHLVPRIVHVGIGCRRGTPADAIEAAVQQALDKAKVHPAALCAVASIDLKKNEAGLLEFCKAHNLSLATYPAEVLQKDDGSFTASAFVQQTVGVDKVCERAAVQSAGGGALLCAKTAQNGVTVALAAENWGIEF